MESNDLRKAVEICEEVSNHIYNAVLGFGGFTIKQSVAFDKILALSHVYLAVVEKGVPEKREYLGHEGIELGSYDEGFDHGFDKGKVEGWNDCRKNFLTNLTDRI